MPRLAFNRTGPLRPLPFLTLAVVCLAAGCGSGTAPPAIPTYNPEGMTQAALKEFDKNGNGSLEPDELKTCPALLGSFSLLDTNRDRKLSAEELKARFDQYAALGAGAVTVASQFMLDGEPLGSATVTFTPEACMLGAIQPGTAALRGDGTVGDFTVGGRTHPGLSCGLYKVSVSKKGGGGEETLPARYNSATTLGQEVFEGGRGGGAPAMYNLSSR